MRKLILAAAPLSFPTLVSAAIIPSWRINPISAAAIAANPTLANARSVSLMVELTNGSLFNVVALNLDPVFGLTDYYQDAVGNQTSRPNPLFITLFPAAEFDTYVATTDNSFAAVPGRVNIQGDAYVGTDGRFDVRWGATPNTGGTGALEIARITATGVHIGYEPISIQDGFVRDSLNPSVSVALPPIPMSKVIPEPAGVLAAATGLALLRSRQRRSD